MVTRSVQRECRPELRELMLKSAALLEELGHRVEHVDDPLVPASFPDDVVLYWGFLALAQVRTGRRMFGETFDRTRLDSLTLGLGRHISRNIHRFPLVIMRLRRLRRRTAKFFGTYDAVLTPTVADETPRIGYLGMPVGMMLSADRGQEARLLELAYELEEARPWARIQASE